MNAAFQNVIPTISSNFQRPTHLHWRSSLNKQILSESVPSQREFFNRENRSDLVWCLNWGNVDTCNSVLRAGGDTNARLGPLHEIVEHINIAHPPVRRRARACRLLNIQGESGSRRRRILHDCGCASACRQLHHFAAMPSRCRGMGTDPHWTTNAQRKNNAHLKHCVFTTQKVPGHIKWLSGINWDEAKLIRCWLLNCICRQILIRPAMNLGFISLVLMGLQLQINCN